MAFGSDSGSLDDTVMAYQTAGVSEGVKADYHVVISLRRPSDLGEVGGGTESLEGLRGTGTYDHVVRVFVKGEGSGACSAVYPVKGVECLLHLSLIEEEGEEAFGAAVVWVELGGCGGVGVFWGVFLFVCPTDHGGPFSGVSSVDSVSVCWVDGVCVC